MILVVFDMISAKYLMYDSLLHHIRHDLEVYGPRNNAGWMSPKVRVSIWQYSFKLLYLKRGKAYLKPYIVDSWLSVGHLGHLLPFLRRHLSLFRFLEVFVKGEPHTHPSAREWRLKKWAWRWRVSKLGLRLTSRTGGWGWWRWWPPHYPRCQPEHGGKPLLKIKVEHFLDIHRGRFEFKYAPLMLAFIPPPPLEWECPCPPWPWLPWEWPWPPWLCSLWEWPWCEWPWSWDEQLLPPWEWAWLKAHIPTRFTSKPPTDTGCTRQQLIKEHKITHQRSRLNISSQLETSVPWLHTDRQHVCVYIRRIQHTGDWLNKDKKRNDHQK